MDVVKTSQALAEHMATQLRVKGDGLAEVTSRAGRRLPKRLRAEAEVIIEAEKMSGNPRLERMVDARKIKSADRRVRKFLDRQDPARVRRGEILDVIAKIAFVIFFVALIVFYVMVQRGAFD